MSKPSDKFYAEITIKVHKVNEFGLIEETRMRSIMHSGTVQNSKFLNECASRTKEAISDTVNCMMYTEPY